MRRTLSHSVTNLLLAEYARQTGASALSRFEPVPLPFRAPIFAEGDRPRFVHFLTSGVASLVALLEEGAEVEVFMSGNEGCPEVLYLLGPQNPARFCFMQVGGSGLRMPFSDFQRWFEEDAILRRLVLELVQFQTMMSMQLVACNGQHDAESRLARWLLMVHDRVEEPELPLTQEFLAQMLGARRSTVTIAASNLQRAGMIEYHRGSIRILDRERLIDTACECDGMIRRLHENLYKH